MAIRTFLAHTSNFEDVWFVQNDDGSLTVSKSEFSTATMSKIANPRVIDIDPVTAARLRRWLDGDDDPR